MARIIGLLRASRGMVIRKQREKTSADFRKKRAFTARYLETVWPRSYWNTGPVRHAPRCCRPRLPPTDKDRPRKVQIAWDAKSDSDRSDKSEASQASRESQESPSVHSIQSAAQTAPSNELPWHQEWQRRYSCRCTDDMISKDQKRQAVYNKMQEIGSTKLVLAQLKGSSTYKFADVGDTSNLQ